ncbi:hypothetical protein [Nocardia amikacinitolerans]|uniref:hypothetical protein n=1 Tax=Nocardia amikacinitolerans TaxID=756689 RepID=UPI0020A42CE9|nr:hypothetical protein [Nocardia amikacinitolerans]
MSARPAALTARSEKFTGNSRDSISAARVDLCLHLVRRDLGARWPTSLRAPSDDLGAVL